MKRITYRTKDHPEANGRQAQAGESAYPLTLPLEDGNFLTIEMGQEVFDTVTNLLMDMLTNAPNHSDGSVPGFEEEQES